MTGKGMTLVEELEQAAMRAEIQAQEATEGKVGARWKGIRDTHTAEAARLRARAERVRELDELWRTDSGHWSAERSAAHALLCGPLPAATPEQGRPKP